MSSDSEGSSSPEDGSYSRGSSISTGLREEYEELLQYAVVTPKFDGKINNNETVTRFTQVTSTIPHVTASSAAAQVVVEETSSSSSPTTDDKPSGISYIGACTIHICIHYHTMIMGSIYRCWLSVDDVIHILVVTGCGNYSVLSSRLHWAMGYTMAVRGIQQHSICMWNWRGTALGE